MSQPKPLASLSSGLLARKGTARPAMRPQAFAASVEDLGWNDLGTAPPAIPPSPAVSPVPVPAAHVPLSPDIASDADHGHARPPVLVERDALAQRIEAPAAVSAVSVPTARRLRRETAHPGKAALTLRLDAERHLRLRLAGAITNRSAQDLLIQALDALLAAVPTVEALVAQLPPPASPRKR